MNSKQKTLHVGAPNIGDRALFDRLVDEIFENRWFTNSGKMEKEFEAKICEYLGVNYCIPVCNATVGLQLACHALDLTGEVIVPAYTFVATAHAVTWERLTPVFADVDPHSHTICPNSVKSLITDATSAIIGVHLWGHPCKTAELESIARVNDLRLMYDAAHAFGCKHEQKSIGNFGECEVFSFHATKFFNTFEGGAITTNNEELAYKIRLMRNFGFAGMDNVIHLGTNAKMTEICAAMGLASFAKIDHFIETNRRNQELYKRLLSGLPGVRFYDQNHLEFTNWQYVIIEIDEQKSGATRDDVFRHLFDNNIRARRYFFPGCHRMEPYASTHQPPALRNTERLCDQVLCLPNGTSINETDVYRVCDSIAASIKQ